MSSICRNRATVPALQIVGLCAFSAYRIWAVVDYGPAVWQDSEAYRLVSLNPWLSGALWAGQRSPGVPVLFKLSGSYSTYSIVEAALGVAAWGLLGWTTSRLVRCGWRRLVVFWMVLGFATAPLVVQWDWSVLSESPSLSALAVMCACALWLVRRFTWVRLAGLGISALVYNALRDADIWDIGLVGLVLVVLGVGRTIRGVALSPEGIAENLRNKFRRTRPLVLVGTVLLAGSILTGTGATISHRNVLNIEQVFYVRIFPFPSDVAWFSSHGMPQGDSVDAEANGTTVAPGQAKVVSLDLSESIWAPLDNWFHHDAEITYGFFLVTHPVYDLVTPFDNPALTYNNFSGQLQYYEPPKRGIPQLETIFDPNKLLVTVLALLSALLAVRRGISGRREWRLLAAFTVVGLVSMLLAWLGEGMEVTRHMVEGDVEVRLGVLLMCLLTLFGERSADAPSEEPQAEQVRSDTAQGPENTGPSPETAEALPAASDRSSGSSLPVA